MKRISHHKGRIEPNAPRLSVCMIVRDEAAMLPGCLESIAGVADEIVVVDTGSVDGTPALADAAGAKLLRHQWADDFSEARNVSIGAATGDWILWMDADERLRPAEHDLIRSTLARAQGDAFFVTVASPTAKGGHAIRAHRLFRNGRGIRFSGRIHEQISPSLSQIRARVEEAEFVIDHLGYALDEQRLHEKNLRNLHLLNLTKEADPCDAHARFSLAQVHMLMGRHAEAEEELRVALGRSASFPISKPLPMDIQAAAWNNLAQCFLARQSALEALECARESLRLAPLQITAHLMAWRCFEAMERHEEALEELTLVERRLEAPARWSGTAIEVKVERADLWRAMGQCCLRAGRPEDARRRFMQALKCGTHRVRTLAALARAEMELGLLPEALAHAQDAQVLEPGDESLLDLTCVALLKMGRFNEAADKLFALRTLRPDDALLARRLAGVLVKAGRSGEAVQVLAGMGPAPEINGKISCKCC